MIIPFKFHGDVTIGYNVMTCSCDGVKYWGGGWGWGVRSQIRGKRYLFYYLSCECMRV